MIRFSAILVAAALAVLVTGVLTSSVVLVYASIGASALAGVLLAVGVWLRRGEIFGDAGSARAGRPPVWPLPEGVGTPAMVGGRARISQPGTQSADPATAAANGDRAEQEAKPGPRKATRGKPGPNGTGAAKTGPGRIGPRIGGGYSGTHSSGRGRATTAPPGRRGSTAPGAGAAARNPGAAAPDEPASGDAGPPRTSSPDRSASPADRTGTPAGDPAASASSGTAGRSPERAGSPPSDRAGSAPDRAGASPPGQPDASESGAPSSRRTEDPPGEAPAAQVPASPVQGWPPAPSAGVRDDFWDRVSEELDAAAQAPPWAVTDGPRAMNASRDTTADATAADASPAVPGVAEPDAEQALDAGQPSSAGQSSAGELWAAWAPAAGERATSPSAPDDLPDQEEAGAGARDGTSGEVETPEPSAHDGMADSEDEDEDEAPSPWSIPLMYVGNLDDLDEDDDEPAAGAESDDDDDEPPAGDLRMVREPARAKEPTQAEEPDGAGEPAHASDRGDASDRPGQPPREEKADGTRADAGTSETGAGAPRAPGEDKTPAGQNEDQMPGPAAAGPAADVQDAPPAAGSQTLDDQVVIVPGVARYHRTGCILIRFMGSDDLETSTRQAAEAGGCIPCRACEPDKPVSAEGT